jgi:antitoxin MazE
MDAVIKTRLVRIGNSQGIRIPKVLLDQLGLGPDIEIAVQQNQLLIRTAQHARAGWGAQFQAMTQEGDDQLLDGDAPASNWDEREWEW